MIVYKRKIKSEIITIQPDYTNYTNFSASNKKIDLNFSSLDIFNVLELLLLDKNLDLKLPERYVEEDERYYLKCFRIALNMLKSNASKEFTKVLDTFNILSDEYHNIRDYNDFTDFLYFLETEKIDIDIDGLVDVFYQWQYFISANWFRK